MTRRRVAAAEENRRSHHLKQLEAAERARKPRAAFRVLCGWLLAEAIRRNRLDQVTKKIEKLISDEIGEVERDGGDYAQ